MNNHFEFKHQKNPTLTDSVNSISVVHGTNTSMNTMSTSLTPSINVTSTLANPESTHQSQYNTGSIGGSFDHIPRRLQYNLSQDRKDGKRKRNKCVEIFLCTPSKLYLIATLLLTALASFLLSFSLTSEHFEVMNYDLEKLNKLIENNASLANHVTISWLFNGRVPQIQFDDRTPPDHNTFLLPIRSGVWTSCIDINELEYDELRILGYDKPHCVDHLQTNISRPLEVRASWQHRMQNLAIACGTVCLILLGAAIVVGIFGVFRPQISAVLVTGVIYMLATLFAVFTLTIIHLKHKNRKEREPLDIWNRLMPDHVGDDFRTTRSIKHGWSLVLGWAGNCVCFLASIMWVILSKIMRYNPNPLSL